MIPNTDYILIQPFMVNDLKLCGNKLIIYAIIFGYCKDCKQEFCQSIDYLCQWTQLTQSTIASLVKSLIDENLLVKREENKNGIKSQYLSLPQLHYPNVKAGSGTDNKTQQQTAEKALKDDTLFEQCWIAYKRKGSKKKSKEYWKKLTIDEQQQVLPHIKAYVSSRDLQYQKDFERYLRDKIFQTIVYQGNVIVFDPTKKDKNATYTPETGFSLNWNDYYNCYLYTGYWNGYIPDGYKDEDRPNGASVTLNNGRGIVVWNSNLKRWEKI